MELLCAGYELTEAPLADRLRHRLLFSDALGGGLWAVDDAGRVSNVVPHRRGIGGAVLHAAGGVVVSGRNVAWKHDGATVVLLENLLGRGHTHFNDLTTDAAGRVYVSLVDMPATASSRSRRRSVLWRIDLDGGATVVDDGTIDGANGMCVTEDGSTLLVADTFGDVVWAFDIPADGSPLRRPRPLIEWPAPAGPDGMARNADGSTWVALHFAGCLVRVDPAGRELERLAVAPAPTSVCHAGDDLTDLIVTTGGGSGGAAVLRARTTIAGRAVPAARIGGGQ